MIPRSCCWRTKGHAIPIPPLSRLVGAAICRTKKQRVAPDQPAPLWSPGQPGSKPWLGQWPWVWCSTFLVIPSQRYMCHDPPTQLAVAQPGRSKHALPLIARGAAVASRKRSQPVSCTAALSRRQMAANRRQNTQRLQGARHPAAPPRTFTSPCGWVRHHRQILDAAVVPPQVRFKLPVLGAKTPSFVDALSPIPAWKAAACPGRHRHGDTPAVARPPRWWTFSLAIRRQPEESASSISRWTGWFWFLTRPCFWVALYLATGCGGISALPFWAGPSSQAPAFFPRPCARSVRRAIAE